MKKNKVTVIQTFNEFIWPRKGIVLVGLILIVVSRLASLVLPLKSKELLDEIIPNQDMDGLINMVLIVAGAILVQAVTSFALTRLLSVEAQLLISKLRAKVQKKVLSFPISYFPLLSLTRRLICPILTSSTKLLSISCPSSSSTLLSSRL